MDNNGCLYAIGMWGGAGSNGLLNPGGGAYYNSVFAGNLDGYIMKLCPLCTLQVIQQPQSQTVCAGDGVTFNIYAISDSGDVNYQWLFNGAVIAGATDSFYTINPISLADAGNYSCEISNLCKSFTSDVAVLTIGSVPVIDLGPDTCINGGEQKILDAGTGYTYLWYDGSTGQTYIVNTSCECYVQVADNSGCKNKDTINIDFCSSSLSISNVFTPNADNFNDYFYAEGENIELFEFVICNRWGKQVFRTNNVNEKWNGLNNGKECPQGVYYWVINYKGFDGERKTIHGTVTLLK